MKMSEMGVEKMVGLSMLKLNIGNVKLSVV